jgi:cysteine desulfurase
MSLRVYFDHHSTTPIDPEVLQVVIYAMQNVYGNPSSRSHEEGWVASSYVEKAREQIAHAIGAERDEIFFTSGATESNNWALSGVMRAHLGHGKKHLIISSAEHRSVRDVAYELERWGFELTELPVYRKN